MDEPTAKLLRRKVHISPNRRRVADQMLPACALAHTRLQDPPRGRHRVRDGAPRLDHGRVHHLPQEPLPHRLLALHGGHRRRLEAEVDLAVVVLEDWEQHGDVLLRPDRCRNDFAIDEEDVVVRISNQEVAMPLRELKIRLRLKHLRLASSLRSHVSEYG